MTPEDLPSVQTLSWCLKAGWWEEAKVLGWVEKVHHSGEALRQQGGSDGEAARIQGVAAEDIRPTTTGAFHKEMLSQAQGPSLLGSWLSHFWDIEGNWSTWLSSPWHSCSIFLKWYCFWSIFILRCYLLEHLQEKSDMVSGIYDKILHGGRNGREKKKQIGPWVGNWSTRGGHVRNHCTTLPISLKINLKIKVRTFFFPLSRWSPGITGKARVHSAVGQNDLMQETWKTEW